MPSGVMPTYDYRPTNAGSPQLETRSARRSRLFAGGTYFRSRETGVLMNQLTVQVVEYTGSTGLEAKCIISNQVPLISECITGPIKTDYLDTLKLEWNEYYKAQPTSSTTAHAQRAAKLQDSGGEDVVALPDISLNGLFYEKGKLAVKFGGLTGPMDDIIIQPRVRIYDLLPKTATDPVSGSTVTGWDISDLRDQVNASDPWVEMLERSGADPTTGLAPEPAFDVQDDGVDDLVLTAFAEQYLTGGDGLPLVPSATTTGPSRSMIHLNYGELYDGSLGVVNVIYEWAGSGISDGNWTVY